MTQANDDIAELVSSLVRQLVDNPDGVRTESFDQENGTVLVEITVDEDDIGKVIGRQGRIIKSIRTIARAAASQAGFHVEVELAE